MTYKFMWVGFDGFVDANVIGLSTKEEVKFNGKPMNGVRAFVRGDVVEFSNKGVATMLSCNGNWISVKNTPKPSKPTVKQDKKEDNNKESEK